MFTNRNASQFSDLAVMNDSYGRPSAPVAPIPAHRNNAPSQAPRHALSGSNYDVTYKLGYTSMQQPQIPPRPRQPQYASPPPEAGSEKLIDQLQIEPDIKKPPPTLPPVKQTIKKQQNRRSPSVHSTCSNAPQQPTGMQMAMAQQSGLPYTCMQCIELQKTIAVMQNNHKQWEEKVTRNFSAIKRLQAAVSADSASAKLSESENSNKDKKKKTPNQPPRAQQPENIKLPRAQKPENNQLPRAQQPEIRQHYANVDPNSSLISAANVGAKLRQQYSTDADADNHPAYAANVLSISSPQYYHSGPFTRDVFD